MYKKRERITVKIIDLADKNQCFGRLEDGLSVFVQGPAAVGDVVEAEIFKIKKNFLGARLVEVLEPSPHRTNPPCSYFGLCGGCKWQHMQYEEQLRLKRKQVQDALVHIGGFKEIECDDCIAAPSLYGYRNKMDFSFTDLRYLTSDEMDLDEKDLSKPLHFALGFHVSGCYAKAIDIDHCHLSTPEMNTTLETVRQFCLRHLEALPIYSTRSHTGELRNLVVRQGGHTDEFMVNLVTSTHQKELMDALKADLLKALGSRLTTFINSTTRAKNTVAFGEEEYILHGPGYITDRLDRYTYRISANSFFQTNTAQAEALYKTILDVADLQIDETVYDLFCGTGSISLFASAHCKRVLGLELVESAVHDAEENAQRNGVTNCRFIRLDLKDVHKIEEDMASFGAPDTIITDPPRAGMNPATVKMLLKLRAKTVIYVSCNPASLARDAKMLCEEGDYRLVSCRPVDMFPQTNHVESVARLELC